MSRPSTAHTPLAREAGRGRGPLRSNGRVRGIPVTTFFAAPCTHPTCTFATRPSVYLSAAPRDRAPLTLPTLTRWAPPSPRCRGARCMGVHAYEPLADHRTSHRGGGHLRHGLACRGRRLGAARAGGADDR